MCELHFSSSVVFSEVQILIGFHLSFKVSDVNDDVRRAAVESIGFILFR